MNIRVPYDKLGDINAYKFISFILDKNKQTIYRQDIVNNGSEKLFSRELPFVTVPDALYKECDSVVFFPFYNVTNSWGTKVIMWKDDEFVKFNGGYEFIRNPDKAPDMEQISQWIKRGKLIRNNNKCVGKKNLIYFTVFGNADYVKLLEILLKTMNRHSYKKFELLFITDVHTMRMIEKIKELKKYSSHFHLVNGVKDAVDASMQKIKIYEWPNISNYKNILFLDVDVIVIGNLKTIFESKKTRGNVFYSATHDSRNELHTSVYHSLAKYTDEQLKNFARKKISVFNAGQFFFRNTDSMKAHFDNINNFISSWRGRYFFEQGFMNHYFNLLEMADTKSFEKQFCFVSINENQTKNLFGKSATVVHFMGNATNGEGKLNFIKKHYSKYI